MSRKRSNEVTNSLEMIKQYRKLISDYERELSFAEIKGEIYKADSIRVKILPELNSKLIEQKRSFLKLIALIAFEIIDPM